MKVAIQGVKASFHDVAAHKFFPVSPFETVECSSFHSLFTALNDKRADYAVMAIENAIAGSILPNYTLMEKFKVKIIGEVFLKIELCLLGLPGEKLEDIRFVQSHPMALLQCQDYLHSLKDIKILEHPDTAESAKEIKEKNLHHYASIASSLAAKTYGMNILAANIETNKMNSTRFLVLVREEDYVPAPNANKASLSFETEHAPGSLARIINIFQDHYINMNKIQSLPVLGRPFHYSFHVDVEWSDRDNFERAMKDIEGRAVNLINLGEYAAGRGSYEA